MRELGGDLRLGAEVGRIMTADGRATGVRLTTGEDLPADIVVCNAEIAAAYTGLLPAAARRRNSNRKWKRGRYSMSLVVIYFGTDRRYRGTDAPALAL
jgi:phytoene desaturase